MILKLMNMNFNISKNNIAPISIDNIDINRIVVSNKLPFDKQDFKYFIGYKANLIMNLYIIKNI